MRIKTVKAVYFSAVGNTKTVTEAAAKEAADILKVPVEVIDFTLPSAREKAYTFDADELVVFGTPTYAGRVPNKVLPFVQELFKGNDTPAIAIVTFGNRNFDSSLTELTKELSANAFKVFAAGGFACAHVFSDVMAAGRPDEEDYRALSAFVSEAVKKLNAAEGPGALTAPVIRDGAEVAPYYTPLEENGQPAKFLPAKPKTDTDKCDLCGLCVKVCPMGSVDEDCVTVSGICIKCYACVSKCPKKAKYIDDPSFLSHIRMLEANYTRRAEPETYL